MSSPAVAKEPLWAVLYDRVLQDLQPGDRLPSERQLAVELGVSRSAVREAMRHVQALGLLRIQHGSGAYRTETNLASLLLPIRDQLANKRLLVEEIVEAREGLECLILRLAFERTTPVGLQKIVTHLTDPIPSSPPQGPDLQFERLLAEMAGNRLLATIQLLLHQLWIDITRTGWRYRSRADSRQEHLAIFEAFRHRDLAEAERRLREHLHYAISRFDELNEGEPSIQEQPRERDRTAGPEPDALDASPAPVSPSRQRRKTGR